MRNQSKITGLTPLSVKKTLMQSSLRSRSHMPAASITTADSTKMAFKKSVDEGEHRMSSETRNPSLF